MSETKAPVGYLFQMTCDTGNGKHLTISGNFGINDDAALMNKEVDKINVVFDRLRAKHEAPLIVERLEGSRLQLASAEGDLALYMKKHHAKARDEGHVAKCEAQIAGMKVAIARGEITLAETQLKAE